ncbi:unnamed protein product [Arabidopsis arenosa]|uniref:Uncharacterized protein n=1 Tax=Arabidopsis arenosa TaxID=38785 RepID=A0A8S2AVU1_ARAAE|nr:unnamed protein product [Arabidopsis arenosa]
MVADSVKSFVVHMYRHIREKNVYEIHQMCETSFQSISERLFKETSWPSVEAIAPYVDNDHVFCLLYREMWFRHLYARLSPTLKQRIDSYDNYCSLFQVVLHGVVNMQLPNQWLWDMVDEFVYQFQSFCQFRAKLKNKTEQEIALLRQHDKAWNVYGVLNFLQALVEKSCIIQILEQDKHGLEHSQLRDKYGEKMMRMLRYDDEAFGIYDELFSYACPKFITPSPPSFEEPLVNYNQLELSQDAYRLQLKMFLYEVKQQQLLSGVRTFLKVYSSISLAKLANYMEVDEPTLRTILLTYKHKTHSVDSDGRIISNADIDF